MLQVIVREVPLGDERQARTIGSLEIRDDQTGIPVMGRMQVRRTDRNRVDHYEVVDSDIRRRDLWSLIGHVSQKPNRRRRNGAR